MSNTRVPKTVDLSFKSPSGVRYSLEEITPEIAEAMLAHNTNNRKPRRARIDAYARDMEGGDWQENGDAICFDSDGNLIDGQHRLHARVASGTSGWMLIVRDLPAAAQDTKDDGAKRTMADTFGFHGVVNQTTAAAVVRRVLMWQNGNRANSGGNMVPTKAEQLEAWRTDSTLRAAVEATVQIGKKAVLPPSVVGLTWWLFSQISTEDCAAFWYGMSTGANLQPGSPILVLRERVAKAAAEPGRIPESQMLAWVIKGWNLWRADKTVSENYRGFKLAPLEKFPEPH